MWEPPTVGNMEILKVLFYATAPGVVVVFLLRILFGMEDIKSKKIKKLLIAEGLKGNKFALWFLEHSSCWKYQDLKIIKLALCGHVYALQMLGYEEKEIRK